MNISVHLFSGAYFNRNIVRARSERGIIFSRCSCMVINDRSMPKFGIEFKKSILSSLMYAPVVTVVIFFVGKCSDANFINS